MADVACSEVCQTICPACWLDTPDRSSSSAARVVQDGMFTGMSLGWFQLRLCLLLGMLSLVHLLMFFELFGVRALRRVYFGPVPEPVVPLKLAVLPFLVEVCYVFVTGVWEAGLLVAGARAGYIVLARVMKLISIVPSTLLTIPLLLYCSFVDA